MSNHPDTRQVIPPGRQQFGWMNLIPVAQLLIERGHPPIIPNEYCGFVGTPSRWMCSLARSFTEEDWAAINERFVLPDNIVFLGGGVIRDSANRVDMIGFDQIKTPEGVISIDEWEEQERREGRL